MAEARKNTGDLPRGGVANLRVGGGRPKGVPNKTTRLAKEAIAHAFEELGGTQGLVDWAKSDPDNAKVFYATIWPKIIPVQTEISGPDGEAIKLEQVQVDADAVTSAIAGLASRAGTDGVAGGAVH